jgi:alpha-glucosidase (family GH31 glycosyl hydrolase)
MWLLLSMLACQGTPDAPAPSGFTVSVGDDGSIDLSHPSGARLQGLRFHHGTGSAEIHTEFGAWSFTEVTRDLITPTGAEQTSDERVQLTLDGAVVGELSVLPDGDDGLLLTYTPTEPGSTRVGFSADCDDDDHFLGFGGHAMDVDHVGQAFPLWVGEPGIGKTLDEEEPPGFPIEGTRHDASFPMPFALRPHHADGVIFDTYGRVEVDLCKADPSRWEMVAWDGQARVHFLAGDGPIEVVQALTARTGRLTLPSPWVFAPWSDAIRGVDRVREVAARLREIGAPASVIWSEDWKGAVDTVTGFRLKGEWFADPEFYPDAGGLADELEGQGYKWFGYFSPFLDVGDVTYEDALANGVVVADEAGEPYVFTGVRFQQTTLVDVSTPEGRSWAAGYFRDALDLGFDGWMCDYAEWLPVDARLNNGGSGLQHHNQYPEWWQQAHAEGIDGYDATYFCRSGWLRTTGYAPVIWAGDQSTDFATDDGLPTVVAMGLGYGASGVPVFTHDVAGYQSLFTEPSDKELWFRWAALGAYSPIYRLHHGSSTEENHQWDTDEQTEQFYVATTREHMRLWPYRYGLARRAAEEGIPMVLPVAFVHGGDDWGRLDAWMLGDALLVAPVLERGVTTRDVQLPDSVSWYTWPGLQPATSGPQPAELEQIPVFVAEGTTVPTFDPIPDTLVEGANVGVPYEEADRYRTVYLVGGGGRFVEGDGTTYEPSGQPEGPSTLVQTLTSGTVSVAGVTVKITGEVERTYTLVVP